MTVQRSGGIHLGLSSVPVFSVKALVMFKLSTRTTVDD